MQRKLSAFLAGIVLITASFSGQAAGQDNPSPAVQLDIPAATRAIPISAFGELPGVETATLSPDGSRLALVAQGASGRRILVVDAEMEILKQMSLGDMKFRSLTFADDNTLLLRRSETVDVWGFTSDKYEISQVIVISLAPDGEARVVFQDRKDLINAVFGSHGLRRTGDGWVGYYGAIELERTTGRQGIRHGRPYLHEYNFVTGKSRRIARAAPEDFEANWVIGSHGGMAAEFEISLNSGKWVIRNSQFKNIVEGESPTGRAGLVGLGADGSTLIFYKFDEASETTEWYEVPLAGGEPVLFAPDVKIERTFRDPETGHLLGYRTPEGSVLFDEARQKSVDLVLQAFVGKEAQIIDHDADFTTVIVHTQGNGDSGTWYKVDVTGRRADPFAFDRASIEPDLVAAISTIKYTAADGLKMDGILTLPAGREARGLPLIVLPHGGPNSHDEEGFDWWAQAFASRGYAVFQPNFRGSTGRGEEFRSLGNGEWGRKMQTDISDGVAFLAEQGTIDPARACIVGASYGGYAALAGVTLQQGLYRCAVSVNGVSDIWMMFRTEKRESGDSRMTNRVLRQQLGDSANWNAISPRDHAMKADAPVLLIHGRDDTVVAFEQSAKMADALKDNSKPHRLIALDGEDHWLSRPETRIRMLEETVAFVQEHNPAD